MAVLFHSLVLKKVCLLLFQSEGQLFSVCTKNRGMLIQVGKGKSVHDWVYALNPLQAGALKWVACTPSFVCSFVLLMMIVPLWLPVECFYGTVFPYIHSSWQCENTSFLYLFALNEKRFVFLTQTREVKCFVTWWQKHECGWAFVCELYEV